MFLLRVLAVWLVIICAETIHGILRTLFLAPLIGDFRARQVGVFTGSLIILFVTCLFIRWLRAVTLASLIATGFIWVALTLLFEVGLGRFAFGLSWDRLASDYDIRRGGFLIFGLIFILFAPLIAAKLRRIKIEQ